MKRQVLLIIALLFAMVSCQDSLKDRLDVLENRVVQLEELCSSLNEEITSMQEIVTALEDNDFVTAVDPITSQSGELVGYQICFSKSGKVPVYFGQDGKNGTPAIGIRKAEDGFYYWTLNNEFITDEDGNYVRASAADGKDGIVPKLKIEEGFWFVSYDNGETWEKYGEAREGSYSYFDDIKVNETTIEIVIGDETLSLPRQKRAGLKLSADNETNAYPGSTLEIGYEIDNAGESTVLMVESNGYYTAQLVEETDSTGFICINCPKYYVDGYVNVILTDNGLSTVKVINFNEGKIIFSEGYEYYMSANGGKIKVNFKANFDYTLQVDAYSGDWLSLSGTTRAPEMKDGIIELTVGINKEGVSRVGKVAIIPVNMNEPYKEIIVHQAAADKESAKSMIFKVNVNGGNNYTAFLPLDNAETLDCTIDWGDGEIDNITPGTELPVTHEYYLQNEANYIVTINGTVTSLNSESLPGHSVTEVLQWGETGLESIETAFINNEILTTIHQAGGAAFKNLKHARRAFENCYALTYLPENMFADCANVTDFNSLFWHCAGLETIPAGLFRNCSNVTNFDSVFGGCISLTEIPADLLKTCTSAETVRNLFVQCEKIESIPADLFKDCSEITSFNAAFHGCTALKEIPGGLFSACTKADDYTWTFYGCHSLKSLPAGLFSNTTNANFFNTFYNCTGLETIPADLFGTCTESATFDGVFNTCRSLTAIPAGLFDQCAGAASFKEAFRDCDRLASVPAGLFAECPSASDFEGTFNGCIKLKEIPENFFGEKTASVNFLNTFLYCSSLEKVADDLFSGCKATTAFEGTFKECVSLREVGDIFQNCAAAARFSEAFRGCSSLQKLSETLFAHSPEATNFDKTFRDCNALQTVPEGLFDNNTEAVNFYQAFANCKSLETIPASLFDHCLKATNFGSTFNNCFSLKCESPYTEIDGVKYHIYERENRTDIFTKPSSHRDCFEACIQLTDYYDIPSSWR